MIHIVCQDNVSSNATIAMISQKELVMALYENQTFVSWSPLLSCFIGSMNANKSLHHHSNLHNITSSWLLYYRRRSIMIIIGGDVNNSIY